MTAEHRSESAEKNQTERFKETARKLGCDEDEAAFKEKLGVIARQKSKDKPEKPLKRQPKR